MIRPLTLITALMFVLSGGYLFAVKHRAETLDDQLAQVNQATRLDEQRIRVLQAQWALEVDPSRLQKLSTEFTALQPMKPSQMMTLADLRAALPPAGGAAPGGNPEDVQPVETAVAAPDASSLPAVGLQAPVHLASFESSAPLRALDESAPADDAAAAAPAPAHLQKTEATLHGLSAARHAPRRAKPQAPKPVYAQSRPAFTEASVLAPLSAPEKLPMVAHVMPVRTVQNEAPSVPPMSGGGSMLGMAQSGLGH